MPLMGAQGTVLWSAHFYVTISQGWFIFSMENWKFDMTLPIVEMI